METIHDNVRDDDAILMMLRLLLMLVLMMLRMVDADAGPEGDDAHAAAVNDEDAFADGTHTPAGGNDDATDAHASAYDAATDDPHDYN